jgi:hypothetical protein
MRALTIGAAAVLTIAAATPASAEVRQEELLDAFAFVLGYGEGARPFLAIDDTVRFHRVVKGSAVEFSAPGMYRHPFDRSKPDRYVRGTTTFSSPQHCSVRVDWSLEIAEGQKDGFEPAKNMITVHLNKAHRFAVEGNGPYLLVIEGDAVFCNQNGCLNSYSAPLDTPPAGFGDRARKAIELIRKSCPGR